MNDLPFSDHRHLEAAEGWLGLGDWRDAAAEVEQIAPELRDHPLVLEMCYKILAASGQWEPAAAAAQSLRAMLPERPWGHFHLAYALHELKRTQEAYDTLKPVLHQFPKEWLMRFNLACYACQLGNLNEAMQWLAEAMDLAGKRTIRQMALEDKDLEPLWARIKDMASDH